MEQRPLRLGDIVDDYCPRERRLTNHVIVAIVDDAIRQTRCTTCDADHVYKGGKEPRRRAARQETSLYNQVLAEAAPGQLAPPRPRIAAPAAATPPPVESPESGDVVEDSPGLDGASRIDGEPVLADDGTAADPPPPHDEAWPAHRPLIRATLPRTENDPLLPRPIPEFTMHQRSGRGAPSGRGHGAWGNGNGPGGPRSGRPDDGHGPGRGHGGGQGRPGRRSGRRRGRHKSSK